MYLTMPDPYIVRPIRHEDYEQWRPLWDGYNAFYGRVGPTALPVPITSATWERFFNPAEAVHALVAEDGGRIVGLVHFLFHRSTTRLQDVCYLQDLFTAPDFRGNGIGRELVSHASAWARAQGGQSLQVKTLAASHPSLEYAQTRAFYARLGFLPVEAFPTLWNTGHPCLQLIKHLHNVA